MENLLKRQSVQISKCAVDSSEDCGVSGEYSLPDYCPNIAVILKCLVTPIVQNRQWSGGQLFIDGSALFRLLYLDEDRCRLHSTEFSYPFSCAMKTDEPLDLASVSLELKVKYVNCRALSPRRVEVRCGITVNAFGECAELYNVTVVNEEAELISCFDTISLSTICGAAEKILTISENFDFPQALPGAEMLLGGECRAYINECKLLSEKAIVKGMIHIHQLYTDDVVKGTTHCLDYALPFSQILDVHNCCEELAFDVHAIVLNDTERCMAGPDGANSVLEVTVKLLIQCKIHQNHSVSVLKDAYHTRYPLTVKREEKNTTTYLGCSLHQSVLPMLFDLPNESIQELLDVWVTPCNQKIDIKEKIGAITGDLMISMLVRDRDDQIVYYERVEEYQLEQPCHGNRANASVAAGEVRYRSVDGKVELQVTLHFCLRFYEDCVWNTIQELQIQMDSPYPEQTIGALMYYAQPGERVWDIGCNCHADSRCIYEENNLNADIISKPTILVVPIL